MRAGTQDHKMNALKTLLASGVAFVLLGGAAFAADAIGSTTNIVRDVTGKVGSAERKLALQDEVHGNELITTAQQSAAEIKFIDDTKATLGPGTRLVLGRYVFGPAKSTSSVKMTVAEGVFRVVTGKSKFGSYTIKTPTATIGIRGTVIDVVVAKDGTTVVRMRSDSYAMVKGLGTIRGDGSRRSSSGGIGGSSGAGNPCSTLNGRDTSTTVLRDGSTSAVGDAPAWALSRIGEAESLLGPN